MYSDKHVNYYFSGWHEKSAEAKSGDDEQLSFTRVGASCFALHKNEASWAEFLRQEKVVFTAIETERNTKGIM